MSPYGKQGDVRIERAKEMEIFTPPWAFLLEKGLKFFTNSISMM